MKVTEEVHKNIEVRLKESAEFQNQLEKKLMEVEKEKQELQDDKRKAIESMEQQVSSLGSIVTFFPKSLNSLYLFINYTLAYFSRKLVECIPINFNFIFLFYVSG